MQKERVHQLSFQPSNLRAEDDIYLEFGSGEIIRGQCPKESQNKGELQEYSEPLDSNGAA